MMEGLLLLPMAELVPYTGIPDYKNEEHFFEFQYRSEQMCQSTNLVRIWIS